MSETRRLGGGIGDLQDSAGAVNTFSPSERYIPCERIKTLSVFFSSDGCILRNRSVMKHRFVGARGGVKEGSAPSNSLRGPWRDGPHQDPPLALHDVEQHTHWSQTKACVFPNVRVRFLIELRFK